MVLDPFQVFFDRFDVLFNDLDKDTFPKHNIVKESDREIRIEIATAGYSRDDLEVSIENNILTVSGKSPETGNPRKYIQKNIAMREFVKRWTLPKHLEIKDVSYVDGLLKITGEVVIPENQQKKLLEIK